MPLPNSLPAALPEDWQAGGFGVYVHWPFCAAKCPYCDFNSHVRQGIDQDAWRKALVADIGRQAALVPGRRVNSVFFGGGTPSLMPAATVAAIIETIDGAWRLVPDAEISLEANPTSVEASRFRGYQSAGVNRMSLGVQALNDADLKRLGRKHSAAEALAAYDVARATFERVSFDLIYARQDQSAANWEAELGQALALAADHLSLYQLTIEDGTRFGDLARRGMLRGLPNQTDSAELYEITQGLCESYGLPAYEVSNHARPGGESRHNLIYWRYGDYAGIGPGAHGRLSIAGRKIATAASKHPEAWCAAAAVGGTAEEVEVVSPADQATEMLMMGLRLAEGIDPARYARLAGAPLPQGVLDDLNRLGLIEAGASRVKTTPAGRMVLNAVLEALLTAG